MRLQLKGVAKATAIGLIGSTCLAMGSASATEGYFQNGYGARQQGLAGAGVADSRDAMALSLNPAGIVGLGQQLQVGVSLFMPFRGYDAVGPGFVAPGGMSGSIDSSSNIFGVPNMAYVAPIDPQSAWGFALFGNGGMNTTYKNVFNSNCGGLGAGVFCGGNAGVDLMQAFLTVGYARSFGQFSLGVAPVVAVQRFKARGLSLFAPFSSDPLHLTNNDYDYSIGAGVRAGVQWAVTSNVRIGVSGQSPIWMTNFDDYRGLFAEQGDFDIPGNVTAGIAFDLNPAFTVMLDYKRIFYGSVPSIANPSTPLLPGSLGTDNGPGFGWHDVDIFKVGAEWRISPIWTLRAGYAHNTNPIKAPDVTFNILAPGVVTDHFSGGFSYKMSPAATIDFGATFVPEHSVSGIEMTPGGPNPGRTITLSMHQFQFTLGLTYQFAPPVVAAKY